jgi:hypothetical protein
MSKINTVSRIRNPNLHISLLPAQKNKIQRTHIQSQESQTTQSNHNKRTTMHSVLSPLAKPFQPIEFAIFNDGVPSSVYYGSHPEHEVLMHIEDDAIDETFPPSASDVSSALVLFACFYDADVHLMSMQI